MERYCAEIAAGWGRFLRNLSIKDSVGVKGVSFLASRSVHLILLDLHLYYCDAKLGPAVEFEVDFMSYAHGLTA